MTCPYCHSAFTSPHLLPCGHTVCSPCIDQLKLFHPKICLCPTCQFKFNWKHWDAPRNYALEDITEIESEYEGFIEDRIMCDECGDMGVGYRCIDCGFYLCQEDREVHGRLLRSKGHSVVQVIEGYSYESFVAPNCVEHMIRSSGVCRCGEGVCELCEVCSSCGELCSFSEISAEDREDWLLKLENLWDEVTMIERRISDYLIFLDNTEIFLISSSESKCRAMINQIRIEYKKYGLKVKQAIAEKRAVIQEDIDLLETLPPFENFLHNSSLELKQQYAKYKDLIPRSKDYKRLTTVPLLSATSEVNIHTDMVKIDNTELQQSQNT